MDRYLHKHDRLRRRRQVSSRCSHPCLSLPPRGVDVWKGDKYTTEVDFRKISGFCQEISSLLPGLGWPAALYSFWHRPRRQVPSSGELKSRGETAISRARTLFSRPREQGLPLTNLTPPREEGYGPIHCGSWLLLLLNSAALPGAPDAGRRETSGAESTMGTGPLLLERAAPHVKTVCTRNPDDYRTGQPSGDGVAWVVDDNPRPGWRWPAPGNAMAAPWHGGSCAWSALGTPWHISHGMRHVPEPFGVIRSIKTAHSRCMVKNS
jgi:hypothetical protein